MKVYGVIGDPIEHSLSPIMHRAAFDAVGMDADYSRFRVMEGDLFEALKGARVLGVAGLNVTVPHKERVAESPLLVNDETAENIGAVNTVDLENMKGYNTDASGARRAVESHGVELSGKRVTMLGAGGAARAITYEFGYSTTHIDIVNRTESRAEELAEELTDSGIDSKGYSLDALEELIPETDIIVNATSVGMKEDRSLVPSGLLHNEHIVFDVVYNPLKTRLLKDAEDAGAKTVDGAWMLVYQGAEAFELWTGEEAPVDAMNKALRKSLKE